MIIQREIIKLDEPDVKVYSALNESQLMHYYEPDLGIFIAESPIVIERALEAGYIPESILIEDTQFNNDNNRQIIKECEQAYITSKEDSCDGLKVFVASESVLVQITGYKLTRGMLCAMRRKNMIEPLELCKVLEECYEAKKANSIKKTRIAVVEDVVNPTNIGAIVRSAAALNIDAILFTEACADPLYRRAIRVSMGTVFQIPWTIIPSKDWPVNTMEILREQGYKFAAMALKDNTKSIADPLFKGIDKLAVILGTEGEGLKEHTIDSSDYTVKIPMSHGVDSLNVAAASAVAFWQLAN